MAEVFVGERAADFEAGLTFSSSTSSAAMGLARLQLADELGGLLGGRCELDPAEITDERGLRSAKPWCLVRPNSTEEVARVLTLAGRHGAAVVPVGGNTGLCAGAVPEPAGECIALSLAGMRQVRRLDAANASITVEAGLTVAEVAAAAAAESEGESDGDGLTLPLRFGADSAAQIGGAIATNAGGSEVFRYGSTRSLVLGLEVVLADGRVFSDLEGLRKDNTGYDLKQLFIGSEGTLGVCTAATLKLVPRLRHRQVALVEVAGLGRAVEFFMAAKRQAGEMLTACEWMSSTAVGVSPGGPDAPPANDLVLLELASNLMEPQPVLEQLLQESLSAGLIAEAQLAQTQNDADRMWQLREQIPQGEKQLGGSVKHDVAVRISDLQDFVADASPAVLSEDPDATLCLYGHLGDGNIHFNVLPSQPINQSISQAVYDTVAQYHGSFSAEHGIGLLHTETLRRYKPPVSQQLMRQLKQTLDPNNILNPGKVIQLEPPPQSA